MGKKNVLGIILALVMVATLCLDSYAVYARDLGESQEPAIENQEVKEKPVKDEKAEKVEENSKIQNGLLKDVENKEKTKQASLLKAPLKNLNKAPLEEAAFEIYEDGLDAAVLKSSDLNAINTFTFDSSKSYTIKVLKDLEVPVASGSLKTINLRGNITVEGDGHTIQGAEGGEEGDRFFKVNTGTITINKLNFDGKEKYAGIRVDNSGGLLTLNNCNFTNCKAKFGGVIYSKFREEANVNITGGKFSSNIATGTGGAICLYKAGEVNIEKAKFEENHSNGNAGAIYVDLALKDSILRVKNCEFLKNIATKNGGAIYNEAKKGVNDDPKTLRLYIENSEFFENKSTGETETDLVKHGGGAIYQSGFSRSEIKKCTFSDNECQKHGGAIYINRYGFSSIEDTVFTKNKSEFGGAIDVERGDLAELGREISVSNCQFEENTATKGGAIYLNVHTKFKANKSKFTKNTADYGGAIFSEDEKRSYDPYTIYKFDPQLDKTKISESDFDENVAKIGGAVYITLPSEISNSNFTKNKAIFMKNDDKSNPYKSGLGGAIFVKYNKTNIKSSKFIENSSEGSGGALAIDSVERNETGAITGLKEKYKNPAVNIEGDTLFNKNWVIFGQGGAIYTIPYSYELDGQTYLDELKNNAYQNLTTSTDTIFKENIALTGFYNPPENYTDYTNLRFKRNSFTSIISDKNYAKSLLNNFDVNYIDKEETNVSAYFDPNGGEFTDAKNPNPKAIKVITTQKGKEIKILNPPKKDGYKFLGWKGLIKVPESISEKLPEKIGDLYKIYKPGDKFKLDSNYIFIAQWEKEDKPTPKPDNKPTPKPTPRGSVFFVGPAPLLNKEDHAQYLIGYQDRTFGAENKMTREEVAVMFSRLLKNPPRKGQVYPYDFSDVARDRWSITAISYMNQLGIIKGYPDGSFKPEASITRAEFAAMAARFADLKEGRKTFTDLDKDYWAYDLIQRAASAGWITGYPDGTFKPDKNITRAEVVAITNRMLDRKADQDFVDQNPGKILQFTDLDKSYWAYYPILEATNGHDYIRHENKLDELWKEVTGKTFVYDK